MKYQPIPSWIDGRSVYLAELLLVLGWPIVDLSWRCRTWRVAPGADGIFGTYRARGYEVVVVQCMPRPSPYTDGAHYLTGSALARCVAAHAPMLIIRVDLAPTSGGCSPGMVSDLCI
jgi:hypothetical protein